MPIFNKSGGFSQTDLDAQYSKGYSAGSNAHGYSVGKVYQQYISTVTVHSGVQMIVAIYYYDDSPVYGIENLSYGSTPVYNGNSQYGTVTWSGNTISMSGGNAPGYCSIIQIW